MVADAVATQELLVRAHVQRLIERRDRYERGSINWVLAEIERVTWKQVADVLEANMAGKTVQPS